MVVLDASALLAYLNGERGSELVHEHLAESAISAANWSEVLTKIDSTLARSWADALLMAVGVVIEPVTKTDAITAADMYARNKSLSLGDRLCLALGERLDARVLTADRAWGNESPVIQIRPE
jgi:PIN domain nuclease of toxin-antitoxin system